MKIHTTQNLDSIAKTNSTNNMALKEFRKNNYSERMHMRKQDLPTDTYENNVSFKGKKEIIKKVIDKTQKVAGKERLMDRILKSDFFDTILDTMSHEVAVQAGISLIVCACLRPLTILAIPTKKSKEDNIYASAHSISSGAVGLVSALLIATPFSKGIKYAHKNLMQNLDSDILKKMYPNLNIESIWKDKAANIRKPINEWKDVLGNSFSKEFKDIIKVAKPKHISEISPETLKILGVDIDKTAMQGKSVNDWVDKNGNKIHLDLKEMFISVKEDGMGQNFFSLQHIKEDYLKELYPDLDLKSIKKDGQRLHTDFWKNIDGSPFKLDMDSVHISSYRETADAIPLYTGEKRFDPKEKVEKYVSYQTNNGIKNKEGVPIKLGTPVIREYLEADAKNEITDKTLGWLPDILTRPIVASATIALIPMILKHVFHLEKNKKQEVNENKVQNNISINKNENDSSTRKVVA